MDQISLIDTLNASGESEFVARLGNIFEHSPWIAARVSQRRPFASLGELHQAMLDVIDAASPDEQLALICAHPELAGKEAKAGSLTIESSSEQQGAGLDRCTPAEKARMDELNRAYRARFGFPFVIAVKGLSRHDILAAMESRLHGDRANEFRECLRQIGRIGGFRLTQMERS